MGSLKYSFARPQNSDTDIVLERKGTTGIVVAVDDHEVMHDIFHGKSIIATPVTSEEATDTLKPGDRIFFYDTATNTLEGEGRITKVDSKTAQAVSTLGDSFYLSAEAFKKLSASWPSGMGTRMLVLTFIGPTMYTSPLRCPRDFRLDGSRLVDMSLMDAIRAANN